MVALNYHESLTALLKDEGGNDDDPADHGGRTSRGITQREYTAWRESHGQDTADVWAATNAEIDAIYRAQYWNPWCDSLPIGVDYLFFDMAVNAGPHRAVILLQRALGVRDDGHIGLITLSAIEKADPIALIEKFTEAKRAFYRSLHQVRFLKGWLNRCDHVQSVATKMVLPLN